MSAIELEAVVKKFGPKIAVDGLTLRVERGSFLGLVGRNGAGKSTTLKMLTGLIQPTSGNVRLLGLDVTKNPVEVKRRIGVMPEEMALLEMLTGPQYLRFVGRMYQLEEATIDRRQAELFELLDLKPGAKTLLADYSYGMKKKVSLCAALMHAPEVVFLDEPFEGIDPVTSRTLKDILLRLRERGVTLVLTTHILELVEKLCEVIAVLDEGRLKGFGSLEDLRQGESLESAFVSLVGGTKKGSLSWL